MTTKIRLDTQVQGLLRGEHLNAPEGFLQNGKIDVSITSNNLTIAIKTLAGTDPSSTNPVYIRIGNTIRTITSALNFNLNAGSNYFNAGSSELATKEIDYFVNLMINTSNGNIYIGCSRITGIKGSDFMAYPAITNEKFLPFVDVISSTDPVVNIGRFSAILSGGAGYTWSEPSNGFQIINRPIYETKELSFSNIVASNGTITGVASFSKYIIKGNTLIVKHRINWGDLTGTADYISFSKPFQDNYGAYAYKGIADTYSSSGHKLCNVFNDATTSNTANRNDGSPFTTGSGNLVVNEFSTI